MVWKLLSCRPGMAETYECRRMLPWRPVQNWSHNYKGIQPTSTGHCYRLLYGFLQGTLLTLLQVHWNWSDKDALTSGAAVRCQHHCKKKVLCPGYNIYKLSESFAHMGFPTGNQGEPHVYSLPFLPMSTSVVLKGLTDHCSGITKDNASFSWKENGPETSTGTTAPADFFSWAGRILPALLLAVILILCVYWGYDPFLMLPVLASWGLA